MLQSVFFWDEISLVTEHTKLTEFQDRKSWLLYDGNCPICRRLAERFATTLRRRGFDLAPLQSQWVHSRLGSLTCEPPDEMLILSSTGNILGGADAVVFLARRIWWAYPLYAIARLPGVMWLLGHLYRWVAKNRDCFGGVCVRSQEQKIGDRKESKP